MYAKLLCFAIFAYQIHTIQYLASSNTFENIVFIVLFLLTACMLLSVRKCTRWIGKHMMMEE